jgi:dTDP-6-deoxy-L-talose 4-dehydrogenase (NAD+)
LPRYKGLFHFEKNLFSSYAFIKGMIFSGLTDVTILGTCFEYGLRDGKLSEDMVSMPANPYALAKDTLRKFLEELKNHFSFNLKWIRLFYLFGEGQGRNSILEQLKASLANKEKVFNMSGGEQLRDYLPVEKVAEYIAKISFMNHETGIINCCSGKPISIRKLVEEYLKAHNQHIELNLGHYPYHPFEPMAFWGSTEKLFSILKNHEKHNDRSKEH